jgi:hypothetical protein
LKTKQVNEIKKKNGLLLWIESVGEDDPLAYGGLMGPLEPSEPFDPLSVCSSSPTNTFNFFSTPFSMTIFLYLILFYCKSKLHQQQQQKQQNQKTKFSSKPAFNLLIP